MNGKTAEFLIQVDKLHPPVRREGGGSIINISSVGGLVPDISQVAYGTGKAAINYLTKLIAVQEAKNGIRCNRNWRFPCGELLPS